MGEPTMPGVLWGASTSTLHEPPRSLNLAVLMKQANLHILLSKITSIAEDCILASRMEHLSQLVTVATLPGALNLLIPGQYILLPAIVELQGQEVAARYDHLPAVAAAMTADEDSDDDLNMYLASNSLQNLGWYLCLVKHVLAAESLITVRICSTVAPITVDASTLPFIDPRVYESKDMLVSFVYDGDLVFAPGPFLQTTLPTTGGQQASALASTTTSDLKLQFSSPDGTFLFIKTDPTKHLEHLAASLPLMRVLGKTPRWLAFFGAYTSYNLRPEVVREKLNATLLLGTAGGCFEGRDLYAQVSKFPAMANPAKFLALLKLKFSMLPMGSAVQLALSDHIDPAHLTYDVHGTCGLTHIIAGLDGIQLTLECIGGPVYYDCLSVVIRAINHNGVIAREYEPKVVALALEQGLLDFSGVMSSDGSNVLDDPRAKKFRDEPGKTALTTIETLQKILLGAVQISALQHLTLTYSLIMKRHREASEAQGYAPAEPDVRLDPPNKKVARNLPSLKNSDEVKKLCTLDLMRYCQMHDFQGKIPSCAVVNCPKLHASKCFPGMSRAARIRAIELGAAETVRKAAIARQSTPENQLRVGNVISSNPTSGPSQASPSSR